MAPMLARVVSEFGVPVMSSGGFDSVSAKYRLATGLADYGKSEILVVSQFEFS